jgi:hypothetical protein
MEKSFHELTSFFIPVFPLIFILSKQIIHILFLHNEGDSFMSASYFFCLPGIAQIADPIALISSDYKSMSFGLLVLKLNAVSKRELVLDKEMNDRNLVLLRSKEGQADACFKKIAPSAEKSKELHRLALQQDECLKEDKKALAPLKRFSFCMLASHLTVLITGVALTIIGSGMLLRLGYLIVTLTCPSLIGRVVILSRYFYTKLAYRC